MIREQRILFILKNPVNPVHSSRRLADTMIKARSPGHADAIAVFADVSDLRRGGRGDHARQHWIGVEQKLRCVHFQPF